MAGPLQGRVLKISQSPSMGAFHYVSTTGVYKSHWPLDYGMSGLYQLEAMSYNVSETIEKQLEGFTNSPYFGLSLDRVFRSRYD